MDSRKIDLSLKLQNLENAEAMQHRGSILASHPAAWVQFPVFQEKILWNFSMLLGFEKKGQRLENVNPI